MPPPPDRWLPVRPGRAGSDGGPPGRDPAGEPVGEPTGAGWWWLGVHGGAGVTTLRVLVPGGLDAGRGWPDPAAGGPAAVVLVCRTHVVGLGGARDAVRQWAAGATAEGVLLAGLVAVADGPGRPARPQLELLRLLRGVVPRLWRVPWVEALRAVPAAELGLHPALAALADELAGLRPAGQSAAIEGGSG